MFAQRTGIRILDHLRTGPHHVLAGTQVDQRQTRIGHEAQADPVAACTCVQTQGIKIAGADGADELGALVIGDQEAACRRVTGRSDTEVIGATGAINIQRIVATAAVHAAQEHVDVSPLDTVITQATVDGIHTATAVNFVIAVATQNHVVSGATKQAVIASTAKNLGAADAGVGDVVATRATIQHGVASAATDGHVIVASVTVERSPSAAVVDEYIIAVTAVEFHVGGHARLDINLVTAFTAKCHQFFDAGEQHFAATKDQAYRFTRSV